MTAPRPLTTRRSSPTTLVVGSRGSKLALVQMEPCLAALRAAQITVEVRIIHPRGDQQKERPLAQFAGEGVFVKEIEEALLRGEIDVAAHSLKDMPSTLARGTALGAIPARDDPRDALVSRAGGLRDLPAGARVGTSSPRRASQLLAQRPDLQVLPLRGNVDTRLRKLDEGQYDAIVMAFVALQRMGWSERTTEVLDPEVMLPAVGQGALGFQCRADDQRVLGLLAPLDHAPSRQAAVAERAFLAALGGGCRLAIAAYAVTDARVTGGEGVAPEPGRLWLRGSVVSANGARRLDGERQGPADHAAALGRELAKELLSRGAGEL